MVEPVPYTEVNMAAVVRQPKNGVPTDDLERRLQKLEHAVAELSCAVRASTAPVEDPRWYVTEAGGFANDPVFDEIVRLGREYQESLRPQADEPA